MDADTHQLLRRSLGKVLVEDQERSLAGRLADLGWDEVLDDDAPTAVRMLFEAKGESVAPGDALGPVLSRAVSIALQRPELAAAEVVLPLSLRPATLSADIAERQLRVTGITGTRPGSGPALVPVSGPGDQLRLAVVPAGAAWSAERIGGSDPDLGLFRVGIEMDEAGAEWIATPDATEAWTAAVAAGRWALGAELLGLGSHVIAAAVAYAGERHQYGRPIGSFQAVQHRLAGAHASLVGAADVVEEAATTASPWVAMVAKAVAGRAAEIGCTQAQQTFGAIGFTWEHGFHRYLRRVYSLDWMLGDWRGLELEIGRHLQATRSVPRAGML